MKDNYDPVFLPNESIVAKKYEVGDVIHLKVTKVMDDGVKAVCSHSKKKPEMPEKEMAEETGERYREAMG